MAADDIIASDLEIAFTEAAIEANRRPLRKMEATGFCYNCQTQLDSLRLFCDADCREDWEFRQTRAKGKYAVFSGMA